MRELFGARYYDARTSVWQSTDPAIGEFLDGEPNNGIFDPININPYRYAALNPIALMDPTGAFEESYDGLGNVTGGTVQKGDTLSQIVKDQLPGGQTATGINSYTNRVAKANNIKNPDLIMPGQNIDLSVLKNDINPAFGETANPGLLDPSAFIGATLAAGLLRGPTAGAIASATTPTASFIRASNFTGTKLSHTFMKHAADWGVTGNWGRANSYRLFDSIVQHSLNPSTKMIQGMYRGNPAVHFFNPRTGLNAIYSPSGTFIGGWKLGGNQIIKLLRTGKLN